MYHKPNILFVDSHAERICRQYQTTLTRHKVILNSPANPPLEFSAWFAANAHFIGRLMIPLGSVAVPTLLLAAAWAGARRSPGWRWLAFAAVPALFIGLVYPLYYTGANAALGSPPTAIAEAAST